MNELVNTREDFMFVNVDNVSFQMEKNGDYVDKSEIISLTNRFVNGQKRFICVTRPRRFGKSVTLICSMPIIQKDVIQRSYSLI